MATEQSSSLPTKASICLNDSKQSIYALTCTSSGEHIICGGKDKIIRLYNPYKSLLIKQYKGGHGYDIQCIKIDNDTKDIFASCGGDKSIFLWDIKTGKIIRKFWGHSKRINCLSFNHPMNNVIVSGSYDQNVLFFDLKSFNKSKPFYKLQSKQGNNGYFKDSITDLIFNQYEIFIVCMDGYLRTFDIRNGKLIKDFICDKGLTSIQITEDNKCILLNCLDDKLRLINKLNGKLLNEYSNDKYVNNQYSIKSCFGFGDEYVISGTENGNILIWDLVEGNKQEPVILDNNDKTSIITNVLSHPKKRNLIFSSDTRGQIKVWT